MPDWGWGREGGERTEMISKFRETIASEEAGDSKSKDFSAAAAASVCFASGGGLGF